MPENQVILKIQKNQKQIKEILEVDGWKTIIC